MKTPIPIWIVGQENFQASHVFNSNAFPGHAKGLIVQCMESLSIFSFSVNQVGPNLERDKGEFLRELRRNKAFDGYIPDPNNPIVFVYKNTRFLVALYLVLSSMKSFLDVYARLVSKLIASILSSRFTSGPPARWSTMSSKSCPFTPAYQLFCG